MILFTFLSVLYVFLAFLFLPSSGLHIVPRAIDARSFVYVVSWCPSPFDRDVVVVMVVIVTAGGDASVGGHVTVDCDVLSSAVTVDLRRCTVDGIVVTLVPVTLPYCRWGWWHSPPAAALPLSVTYSLAMTAHR